MLGSVYEAEGTHGVGDDDDVEDGYRRWISGYPDDADPVTWISGSGCSFEDWTDDGRRKT